MAKIIYRIVCTINTDIAYDVNGDAEESTAWNTTGKAEYQVWDTDIKAPVNTASGQPWNVLDVTIDSADPDVGFAACLAAAKTAEGL